MNNEAKKLEKATTGKMIASDYLTASLGWLGFWLYRQYMLLTGFTDLYLNHRNFTFRDWVMMLVLVPGYWLIIYYLSGTYSQLYRKSRLTEIYRSFISSVIGTFAIGLLVFANDTDSFKYYFQITAWYFFVHFTLLLISRLSLYALIKKHLRDGIYNFTTIIIGQNGKMKEIYGELVQNAPFTGNKVIGYVPLTQGTGNAAMGLPCLGTFEQIEHIIDQYQVDEAVVAVSENERKAMEQVLIALSYRPVIIKALPDLLDLISGSVKTTNVFDNVFISIRPELLSDWQKACKRVLDVVLSLIAMLLLLPVYLTAAIKVRRSSSGPIFFRQERIGLYGRKFYIYKFRSMYVNSEADGPALSHDADPRITPWGRIMRKWRID